jgi:hypothetical protein
MFILQPGIMAQKMLAELPFERLPFRGKNQNIARSIEGYQLEFDIVV